MRKVLVPRWAALGAALGRLVPLVGLEDALVAVVALVVAGKVLCAAVGEVRCPCRRTSKVLRLRQHLRLRARLLHLARRGLAVVRAAATPHGSLMVQALPLGESPRTQPWLSVMLRPVGAGALLGARPVACATQS